jgi:hypothetical protein
VAFCCSVDSDAGAIESIAGGSCRDMVWVIGGCKLLTAEVRTYLFMAYETGRPTWGNGDLWV